MKKFRIFQKKGKLLTIIIDTERIDGDIEKLMKGADDLLNDLTIALEKDDHVQKDEDTRKLQRKFVMILEDVDKIIAYVRQIRMEELQEKRRRIQNDVSRV